MSKDGLCGVNSPASGEAARRSKKEPDRRFEDSPHGLRILSKKEYEKEYHYWSNSCGDLYHNGQDITEKELPVELRYALDNLWEENEFGLNCFLVEHEATYGISLEAGFDDCYAGDLGCSRKRLDGLALSKAAEVAAKIPEFCVFYGDHLQEWSDGSEDTLIMVLVPWGTDKEDYKRIGTIFGDMAYSGIEEAVQAERKGQ